MPFLRRFSIGTRVLYGFLLLGGLSVALCTALAWRLQAVDAGMARWAFWMGVGLALLAVGLGTLISRSVKGPVEALVSSVQRLASGDLHTKISSPGRDDISWLNHELNTMRKKLGETVKSVRDSAESVRLAASEIAQGNTDLSNRTEEQAAALQETASSMDQLAGTVQENARVATEANEIVTQANTVASQGGQLMQEVVARMADINTSASRIAEIVQVIDSIAFQTNILALNAAVEAARAGEQGRGFAVVASEVRNLAQRSANAAKEVKTLINESTEKVDAGFQLVDQAGDTMKHILTGVERVSHLVSSMAQSGQAQHSGITQIHQAVANMDQMTQQNAALVEQASAAALSLRDQSERLTQSMQTFKIAA